MRLALPLFIFASAIAADAATVSTTTTHHGSVSSTGVLGDQSTARMASYYNTRGFNPAYLVMDFNLTAASFGYDALDDISQATITLTHDGGASVAGRFDVYYVENSSPSITTGSTELVFAEYTVYGFNPASPPASLAGLTKVAASFYVLGTMDININLSAVESAMKAKINAGETIRFIFAESPQTDNTATSWYGLGNDPALAPRLAVTAVPEPASTALLSSLFLVFSFSRRRVTSV
ncbi:PEP-CTERM sorting domain-containing protein [Luteolibacter yonseiensis]|uniref:PEP-CTERM sorting domain-containing protein n=1 Tax=Luteolibacter yonseiensis TaxID=1144680 RepID=A0A934R0S5_9BACT|nr:PEP-CTERM sorting domain-containing protein [Luteolibacter yonseiensis]MBK1814231.1 PEP-CTERM sorting domain-containing protein [Luteolibacter yonseiensis]